MLVSMTGYGKAERQNSKCTINVEIKALNNRFVDIILKSNIPNFSFEEEIMSNIKKKCVRGRINININIVSNKKNNDIMLNTHRLKKYMKIINNIKQEIKLDNELMLSDVLRMPNIISEQDLNEIDIKNKIMISRAVKAAIKDLENYRVLEGKSLYIDIKKIFNKINQIIKKIGLLANTHSKKEVKYYKNKIKSILPDLTTKLDNDRIYQEIAIIMEKKDINEEIIRLKSHMKLFNIYLSNKEYVGKKMNFLLQEMIREINTIGSKSDKVKINHLVVDVKDSLEKIKEQIQNIL